MVFYNGITKEDVLKIHSYIIGMKKKNKKLGQVSLRHLVKEKFNVGLKESTISGWIYRGVVPFANEKTQFKPKPIPPKEELCLMYIKKNISAQRLSKKYKVSTVIVINWLRHYSIPVRSRKESMNTPNIKKELRNLRLIKPTKAYKILSPAKAYILSVLAGDATISGKSIRIEIRKDIEFIEKFVKAFEEVYGLKYNYHYYKARNSYVAYISSEIISKDLLKYGNFKTHTWFVPKEIKNSRNKHLIVNYLKGFYDSEGSVGRYHVRFTTASKIGSIGISSLLEKLGIKSHMYCDRKYFLTQIGRKDNLKLFKNLIGFTIFRKKEKLENMYRLGW